MFTAVEQDDRQSVAELCPQCGLASCRFGVDVGFGQLEVEFFGELGELRVTPSQIVQPARVRSWTWRRGMVSVCQEIGHF